MFRALTRMTEIPAQVLTLTGNSLGDLRPATFFHLDLPAWFEDKTEKRRVVNHAGHPELLERSGEKYDGCCLCKLAATKSMQRCNLVNQDVIGWLPMPYLYKPRDDSQDEVRWGPQSNCLTWHIKKINDKKQQFDTWGKNCPSEKQCNVHSSANWQVVLKGPRIINS